MDVKPSRWSLISGIGGALLMLLGPIVAQAQEWIYTVRPGDTIWSVTEDYLTDMRYWHPLQQLNAVADPEHMPPGMRLRVPVAWLRTQPSAVRVLNVQGDAKATTPATGQTVALSPEVVLRSGDEVRTGAESNAILEFADGSRLLLQADSHLVLDAVSAYGDTGMADSHMRLQRGRASNRVNPNQGAAGRYEIRTPAAVTAVRGTDYRVGMDPAESTARAEVLKGRVTVSGAHKTRELSAGFGTTIEVGKPPAPPVPLLAPPNVAVMPKEVARVPIQLSFPALAGAVAYRVQIAPTEDFKVMLFDSTVKTPHFRGPDLPDGDYILRIRGIDSHGLEGRDGVHPFRLNARPEPPVLLEPQHNATVRQAIPTFQWSEPTEARSYHFQLADNDQFTRPLIDIAEHSKGSLTLEHPLTPGFYYWRVATTDSTGEQGGFGDTQGFKLRPAPSSPQLQEPTVEQDTMVFRWSAGLPGQQYQFQLADDPDFETVIVNKRTTEPQLTVARPASGFHFLRIRTIDTDGYEGPYGSTQRIDVPPASYWPLGIFAILVLVLAL